MQIKVSVPQSWGANPSLSPFLERDGTFGGHHFYCDPRRSDGDAWVVFDDVNPSDNRARVPRNRVFLVTAESVWADDYWLDPGRAGFLRQFSAVASSHYSSHPNHTASPPFLPWMLHANHGSVWAPHSIDLQYLRELNRPEKSKDLSVICSTKAGYPGHRVRLDFVRRLKSHFGERLDWFGNGVNPLEKKIDGLLQYRASIVVENQIRPDLYTEKLIDPLLAHTIPMYAGAPNVGEYFDLPQEWLVDMRDFVGSVDKIEALLADGESESNLEFLRANRLVALEQAHFLKRISRLVEDSGRPAEIKDFALQPAAPVSRGHKSGRKTAAKRFMAAVKSRIVM